MTLIYSPYFLGNLTLLFHRSPEPRSINFLLRFTHNKTTSCSGHSLSLFVCRHRQSYKTGLSCVDEWRLNGHTSADRLDLKSLLKRFRIYNIQFIFVCSCSSRATKINIRNCFSVCPPNGFLRYMLMMMNATAYHIPINNPPTMVVKSDAAAAA